MSWMDAIVEERIRESIKKGEFDGLPGAGKPLSHEDDTAVPDELRLGYKLLKNAGMLPEELQLRKELLTLEELLNCCKDEAERGKLREQLSVKKLRYELLMKGRSWQDTGAFLEYERRMQEKLTE